MSARSVSVLALGDDSRSAEWWMSVGKVFSMLGLMARGCRMLGTCEGEIAERAREGGGREGRKEGRGEGRRERRDKETAQTLYVVDIYR